MTPTLRSPSLDGVSDRVQERLRASAREDFRALWAPLQEDADDLALKASQKLAARGHAEADALRAILELQKSSIDRELSERTQMELPFGHVGPSTCFYARRVRERAGIASALGVS